MDAIEPSTSKPMNLGVALLISFLLFTGGNVISETLRWTDHFKGFQNGAIHTLIFGFAWVMYGIPWYLLGCFIYRKRNWEKHEARWVIAPGALMFITVMTLLVIDPPTPAHRFKQIAETELPGNLQELHFRFTGGGIADISDRYYFKTTPDEMESLIARMRLEPIPFAFFGNHDTRFSLPDCPEISSWKGVRLYSRNTGGECPEWFFYLVTDETKTQAYVWICET